jgi:hypothetical protein
MPSVITLNVANNAYMLSVVMLSVVMLNVVMLSVVTPHGLHSPCIFFYFCLVLNHKTAKYCL